jgi:uncharacterized protein YfaP (DUF2135 family)
LAEKLDKKRQILPTANSLKIPPTQRDIQSHNDPQMSLDYHLVDPLGDDEKDEQQSDVLDGC